MLNKKYCVKCWNEYDKTNGWTNGDEKRWNGKEGLLMCPGRYTTPLHTRKITKEPPTKCPFILEHILTNKGNKCH